MNKNDIDMNADWIDIALLTTFAAGASGAVIAITLLIVAAVKRG